MKSIFSDDYKRTVRRIREARVKGGISQAELAEKLGTTQSHISKIEHGQSRIDVAQLKELARALNINVQDLLK
jgi:transcriptional regulator with XRE-family HTH domain